MNFDNKNINVINVLKILLKTKTFINLTGTIFVHNFERTLPRLLTKVLETFPVSWFTQKENADVCTVTKPS